MRGADRSDERVLRLLLPDERIDHLAHAVDAVVAVTDRRLVVVDERGPGLDVRFEELRRIQFDIERSRPATLVVVPERPTHVPQVLSVEPRHYREVAEALTLIGERL